MNSALRAARENQKGTFHLQITSMIDMFTIILVFLLKSYASSAIDISPSKALNLPSSTAAGAPIEALKLMVSKEGIFVDDKNVLALVNGELPKDVTDANDPKFIRALYDALALQVQKTKSIAKQNESVNFEGKIIFQADRSLNYQLIRKVMYTTTMAGYSDFKFAVVSLQ